MKKHIPFFIFLPVSITLHLAIFMSIYLIESHVRINKVFTVFGMHSKKEPNAFYKPLHNIQILSLVDSQFHAPPALKKKKPAVKKTTIKKKANIKNLKKQSKKSTKKKSQTQKKKQKTPQEPTKKKTKKKITNQKLSKKSQNSQTQSSKKKIAQNKQFSPHDNNTHAQRNNQVPTFNFMSNVDRQLSKLQLLIQQEISRLWSPPVGVGLGTEATLCFSINKKGLVEEVKFVKHSKILIYDLSISQIAKKFKFDKPLWGKKFVINFRQ